QPVYFWHAHQANGFLGQWYDCPFTVDGNTYATAEMWMMVQKALLFSDTSAATKMLATTDPKRHKALGRQVKNFDPEIWDANKVRIVEEGNYHKFTKSGDAERLRGLLEATGERELVEASKFDRVWGIGFVAGEAERVGRERWGENLLGVALMGVRERLRREGK
ncbi:hypothetical protein GQ44DRAFT_585201, partial [Phaeosphaeriaceae sp. PMI808]